jgi:hypothetical protein
MRWVWMMGEGEHQRRGADSLEKLAAARSSPPHSILHLICSPPARHGFRVRLRRPGMTKTRGNFRQSQRSVIGMNARLFRHSGRRSRSGIHASMVKKAGGRRTAIGHFRKLRALRRRMSGWLIAASRAQQCGQRQNPAPGPPRCRRSPGQYPLSGRKALRAGARV